MTAIDTGIDPEILSDLVLKLAYRLPSFTAAKAADDLALASSVVSDLLTGLKKDKLVENLGAAGPLDYRYALTEGGRERARRLFEICGYVGPAPVSLDAYTEVLNFQLGRLREPGPDEVASALNDLVIPRDSVQIAGLAGSSGRSLFIYGPPGNGKTTLGYLLHNAVAGHLWIPHCIGIENTVIRIYDPRFHKASRLEIDPASGPRIDRRWIRVRRPFIVVGGELTIDSLDLGYNPELGYYEAPLHLKANGGTFLLDDLGHQRVSPQELLSRWIFPLENRVDCLTLQTGQKLQVPFRQHLIVSTNLDPDTMLSAAFMRRMGYRLYLGDPTPDAYTQAFRSYAARLGLDVAEGLIESLLRRYEQESRPLRGCEPRDLIERSLDICRFNREEPALSHEVLHLAWRGYFGNTLRKAA
jgi:predicted ATPase with chaperone activity